MELCLAIISHSRNSTATLKVLSVRSQPGLTRICWSNRYNKEGELPIIDAAQLPQLKMLDLKHNGLASIFLPRLPVTHITIQTVEEIVSFGVLSSIRALIIMERISTPQLEILIRNLPNLEFLDIGRLDIVSILNICPNPAQTGCLS